jgi:hypothetical protein
MICECCEEREAPEGSRLCDDCREYLAAALSDELALAVETLYQEIAEPE